MSTFGLIILGLLAIPFVAVIAMKLAFAALGAASVCRAAIAEKNTMSRIVLAWIFLPMVPMTLCILFDVRNKQLVGLALGLGWFLAILVLIVGYQLTRRR